ncbi:MAG TPA: DUF4136 domain-containing protein [Vicinamibacterales bacterium]|nr:DUF4136 domain-containing protein [Vicinamibacterales bacterium]
MTSRVHALTVALVLLLGSAVAVAGINVRTEIDKKFDFTKLKTFAWHPHPGEVKILLSKDSNARAEPVKRQYEPLLMKTVEEEMVKRGYTMATAGAAPDFQLIYYVFIATGTTSQAMGQFLPTNATWGLPMFPPATQHLDLSPQGSIVLDAAAPAGGALVWRGVAESRVELTNSEEQRARNVKEAMTKIVAKFPKRK